MAAATAWVGTVMHTPILGQTEVLLNHLLIVKDGVIVHLGPYTSCEDALRQHSVASDRVKQLSPQQWLMPGFVDTHAHAPQFFFGVGTDLPLFEWLNKYTFPSEASFSDVSKARQLYRKVVHRLLRLGTTTANYFTTLHVEACKALADVCAEAGQRVVLGKVCMDQHSPDFYTEQGSAVSLAAAGEVVNYIQGLRCSRIMPAVIPRFIVTCSMPLLQGLGQMAEAADLHVHSHISESLDQVEFTAKMHPEYPDDAAVYDAAGLLRPKAVFAHATKITKDALLLMAERGAAVAHCPLSNFYFGDGLFDVLGALRLGVKVGLGTDIAGGYSPSMLQAMRMAVVNSHALKAASLMYAATADSQQPAAADSTKVEAEPAACSSEHPNNPAPAAARVSAAIANPDVSAAAAAHMLTWEDALWLATAGGAAALGLSDKVGHFAVGMEFDALLVDAGKPEVFDLLDAAHGDAPLAMLEHFWSNGDDRNIVAVYVQGQVCTP